MTAVVIDLDTERAQRRAATCLVCHHHVTRTGDCACGNVTQPHGWPPRTDGAA